LSTVSCTLCFVAQDIGGGIMQQEKLYCQKIVKEIRDTIRTDVSKGRFGTKAGMIKISIIPCTIEADAMLGGFSDGVDDFANYEYGYSLNKGYDFSAVGDSGYATYLIKERTLISHGDGTVDGIIYAHKDFLDVTVRVCGANEDNKKLAETALEVLKRYFPESEDFIIRQ